MNAQLSDILLTKEGVQTPLLLTHILNHNNKTPGGNPRHPEAKPEGTTKPSIAHKYASVNITTGTSAQDNKVAEEPIWEAV